MNSLSRLQLIGIIASISAFIICWIVSWSTLCLHISKEWASTRLFLLAFGLLGPLLDFAKNSYVWQMVSLLEQGNPGDQHVMGAWVHWRASG